ncbi:LysR family transcriptional regulator [Rhizobium leguminosarum]|uniref:LysR family transcriptional regulator n=1 Tax=Rhizobium leguminosarum TaxID=384 RepID=UPI000487B875|nr:LysR family transcriptional regulator [Rhizobium leguminosarum]
MKSISLDKLKVFVAVAEHGTLSAAGRSLGRPQSAVSELLSSMEGQLGFRLFDRTQKKTELTFQGVSLLNEARLVLSASDVFDAKAAHFRTGVEAQLSFAIDVMFPTLTLLSAVNDFRSEYPETGLSMVKDVLGGVVQPLLSGQCSFAIIGSLPHVPTELVTERIRIVPMCPVAAPSHPLAAAATPIPLASMDDHRQIVVTDKTALSDGKSFGVMSSNTWSVADLISKLEFLRAGFGWGFMPQHMVRDDLEAGRLVELATAEQNHPDGWLPVVLFVAYKRNRPPGPAARWLVNRLREGAGDLSDEVFFRG